MKRLILAILVLAICGGVVFFVGWVQILIPDSTYGVAFSRTSGWRGQAIRPGTFFWTWERLLPTNFRLYHFPSASYTDDFSLSGRLPSAELIQSLLDGRPDFTFDVQFRLAWSIEPDHLVVLARDAGVRPDGFTAWLESLRAEMRTRLSEVLEEVRPDVSGGLAALTRGAEAIVRRDFPFVRIHSLSVVHARLPDIQLYNRGRELLLLSVEARKGAIAEAAASRASRAVEMDERFIVLDRYGQLLTKYPILLELLKIADGEDGLLF